MSMTTSGLASVSCVYYVQLLGLLSGIELCIFLCRLVLFVSILAKLFVGKTTTLVISFMSKVSPTKTRLKSYLL